MPVYKEGGFGKDAVFFVMKNLFRIPYRYLFLSLVLSVSVGLADSEKAAKAKETEGVKEADARILEAFGASMGGNLSRHFELSPKELNLFIKGFRKGYEGKIAEEELREMGPKIQAFLEPRREAARVREREKQLAALAKLRLPMDLEVSTSTGEKTTLGKLAKGKKGVLLDFWASWCGPCLALMPELEKKAEKYGPQGIVVAGMNTENTAKAEGLRKKRGIEFAWLVEPEGRPFSRLLKINSIPRMILVSPEGKVLFNGHPKEDALVPALAKLGVK